MEEAMSLPISIVGLAAALAITAAPCHAQEFGNVERGKAYAEQLCSDCHRIGRLSDGRSDPKVPPFTSVAKTKGMTAMALSAWLQTSHPTMPNIRLKPETMDDIIAYILSLRPAPEPAAN